MSEEAINDLYRKNDALCDLWEKDSNNNHLEIVISNAQKILELRPAELFAHNDLSYAYDNLGKFELALKSLSIMIDSDVKDPVMFYQRGRVKQSLKKYSGAVKDYDVFLEKNPKNPLGNYWRGVALHHMQKFDKAIESFSTALKEVPKDFDILMARGVAYHENGAYKKARNDFLEAYFIEPRDTETIISLAEAYRCLDDDDNAKTYMTRLHNINPDLFNAMLEAEQFDDNGIKFH